ncbi:MotE family protein [Indiicoccus explosivorum]|uniref:MotE family protein n=1 Tax=Indiicoccus explosivorum TaxID=1917864 RepID=UPI00138FFD41|nr:hypothetical protein [Indiicoccus explosivorum]
MKGKESTSVKKPGKALLIFSWGVIPALFALAVFLTVAQVLGWSITEKLAPLTGDLLFSGEETEKTEQVLPAAEELQQTIQEKEAEISTLQAELEASEQLNSELLAEQEKLLHEIAVLERTDELEETEFKEVVATFEAMSAKSAAPILSAMETTEALRIFQQLTPETAAAFLEKMDPELAADFTEKLSN